MREIRIAPMQRSRLSALLSQDRNDQFDAVAAGAQKLLKGRVVWNVNATAQGGGVAEMLQTLLAYVRGVGVDTRWLVLSGSRTSSSSPNVSTTCCTASRGTADRWVPPSMPWSRRHCDRTLRSMASLVGPSDFVILHDPQTAGMVGQLREAGAKVVWRCHIGRDTSNALTNQGWAFLRPLIEDADAFVFSRASYAPAWIRAEKLHIITPSIDPFSAKNAPLTDAEVEATLGYAGLLEGDGGSPSGDVREARRHPRCRAKAQGSRHRRHADTSRRAAGDPGQPLGPPQGHGRGLDGIRRQSRDASR